MTPFLPKSRKICDDITAMTSSMFERIYFSLTLFYKEICFVLTSSVTYIPGSPLFMYLRLSSSWVHSRLSAILITFTLISLSEAFCWVLLGRRNLPIPSIRATEFLLEGPDKVVMLELLTDDVSDDATDDTRLGRLILAEFSRVSGSSETVSIRSVELVSSVKDAVSSVVEIGNSVVTVSSSLTSSVGFSRLSAPSMCSEIENKGLVISCLVLFRAELLAAEDKSADFVLLFDWLSCLVTSLSEEDFFAKDTFRAPVTPVTLMDRSFFSFFSSSFFLSSIGLSLHSTLSIFQTKCFHH